jgi:hypothetical protein
MKFRLSVLLFVLTAFVIAPLNLFACACCSENGFYSISTGKPDDYKIEILEQIKFAETAELYLDESDFEYIKGLENLASNSDEDVSKFMLTDIFAAKTWKMNFKSTNGKTGTLNLPLPSQMVSFKVDIHDGKKSGGGGPLLYKEWRFKGNVQSGIGFFKSGIVSPTTYFLVLQGRGNGCDNAEDFTNWRLEINGKKANYKFYGELKSGAVMEEKN